MRPLVMATLLVALAACDPSTVAGRAQQEATVLDAGACTDDDRADIVRVVDEQLVAIRRDDWSAALAVATDSFRQGFDPASFGVVIEEQFPTVAGSLTHETGPCLIAEDVEARLVVVVVDDAGQSQPLTFLLERQGSEWRIGGALPLDAPTEEDPGPIA